MLEKLKLDSRYDGLLYLAESARNPPTIRSHRHVELELNLVIRGEITYIVAGRRFTFPQRTLLWMFPAQEHRLIDRTADASSYVAVFKPELIARASLSPIYEGLERTAWPHGGVLHVSLEAEAFDLVRRTMDALMADALDPDVLNRELGFGPSSDFHFEHGDPEGLNAGLHHLLLLCWRYQLAGNPLGKAVTLHAAVRKALDLLAEGGCEDSGAVLARRCGVSEAYLSRVFARQVGITLSKHRNSVRLTQFWQYYRSMEKRTITEAVYAAGFGSYAQFYKVFSETYGCGPRTAMRMN